MDAPPSPHCASEPQQPLRDTCRQPHPPFPLQASATPTLKPAQASFSYNWGTPPTLNAAPHGRPTLAALRLPTAATRARLVSPTTPAVRAPGVDNLHLEARPSQLPMQLGDATDTERRTAWTPTLTALRLLTAATRARLTSPTAPAVRAPGVPKPHLEARPSELFMQLGDATDTERSTAWTPYPHRIAHQNVATRARPHPPFAIQASPNPKIQAPASFPPWLQLGDATDNERRTVSTPHPHRIAALNPES